MRLLIFMTLLLLGCSTQEVFQEIDCSKRISPIPKNIIAKMDSFVVSKTGQGVFDAYFLFDSVQSGLFPGNPNYLKPNYVDENRFMAYNYCTVVYYFRLPDKPWHKWKLWWQTDTLGQFIKGKYPYGIPDCLSPVSQCEFAIDSIKAIEIAEKEGLKADKTPLSAGMWLDKGKIAWLVRTTVTQDKYDAEVKYYTIDMNSGEVISKGGWTIVH